MGMPGPTRVRRSFSSAVSNSVSFVHVGWKPNISAPRAGRQSSVPDLFDRFELMDGPDPSAYSRRLSITLNHLRIFSAVAREGRFARASEVLHVSEPTVSDQIKTLERLVGTRLIERSSGRRQLRLTKAGEILLQGSEEMFQSLDTTLRRMEAAAGSDQA